MDFIVQHFFYNTGYPVDHCQNIILDNDKTRKKKKKKKKTLYSVLNKLKALLTSAKAYSRLLVPFVS